MCRAHSKEAYKVKSNTSSYNNIILCIYEHVVYKYEIYQRITTLIYFYGSYIYLRKYSRSLSTELVRASTCRDS